MKSISVAATGGKCEFDGGFDGAAKTCVNQNDERESGLLLSNHGAKLNESHLSTSHYLLQSHACPSQQPVCILA